MAFTNERLAGLPPPTSGQDEYADEVIIGLRIRVFAGGTKSFVLRRRFAGKVRNVLLGRFCPVSFGVAEARAEALKRTAPIAHEDLSRSKIPINDLASRSFEALAEPYLRSKSALRSATEIERIFRREILPRMGSQRADAVTRSDITRLIEEVGSPAMARAVAAQLSAFFSWLMQRSDLLASNPCIGAAKPRPNPARDRVLSPLEISALWKVLAREPAPFGPGFTLLLLTLQRRSEVFDADCSEFDLSAGEWVIPAARTKNGRVHFVPLGRNARLLLRQQIAGRRSGKLFPAKGNAANSVTGFSKAWRRVVGAVETTLNGTIDRFTIHDLRRTGASVLQRLGTKIEVTEALLNHVSGARGGLVAVYQRYDYVSERIAALAAWETELETMVAGLASRAERPVQ